MVDPNKCIGCGTCVNVCPVNAITLDENGHAKIDKEICIKCHTCESVCPCMAIKIDENEE